MLTAHRPSGLVVFGRCCPALASPAPGRLQAEFAMAFPFAGLPIACPRRPPTAFPTACPRRPLNSGERYRPVAFDESARCCSSCDAKSLPTSGQRATSHCLSLTSPLDLLLPVLDLLALPAFPLPVPTASPTAPRRPVPDGLSPTYCDHQN